MDGIVLYLSSKSMKQTIEHSIKEMNLFSLDFNNQIGNLISLKDFVKYKGLTLSDTDIDYLIIDLGALKDDDDEILLSVQSFMIAHEDIRIIILSQIHEAGDKILSDLFNLGVRNFAISNDYVDIKSKLNTCLSEKGMNYKDALDFKEIKDRSKKDKIEIKEVNKVMIGIIGTEKKVGCTHNSIILANNLKDKGYSVGVFEINKSTAFEEIRIAESLSLVNGYFSSRNIDYYPNVNGDILKEILKERVYNFVILDFGDFKASDINLFNKCHLKLAIGNASAWEVSNIVDFWNRYDEIARENINLYINFIEKSGDRKELEKVFKKKINFISFTPDPFAKHKFIDLDTLIQEYASTNVNKPKKRLFGIFKNKR